MDYTSFWTAPEGAMSLWVVYDRPDDYPEHAVIRRHDIYRRPAGVEMIGPLVGFKSLKEVRLVIPPGRVRLNISAVPCMVEVWI